MAASPQSATPPRAIASRLSSRTALSHPAGAPSLRKLLAFWHLLSLDAPAVASLWAVFIAEAAHVPLPWTVPAAMFVAVWVLYATDRLLDSRSLRAAPAATGLEARHRFHFAHRRAFLTAIALCCPALIFLLHHANPAAIRLHLLLGTLLLGWLLLIHLRPAAHRLPKELAVGMFFPAAVFIPTVARVPELRLALLPSAVLLAAVCSLNCLYIYAWEHPHDPRQAHATTRWAIGRLPGLTQGAFLVALVAACALPVFLPAQPSLALPAIACAGSALCLHWLHRNREQFSLVTLRAAADLALLTPAPLLLLQHVRLLAPKLYS